MPLFGLGRKGRASREGADERRREGLGPFGRRAVIRAAREAGKKTMGKAPSFWHRMIAPLVEDAPRKRGKPELAFRVEPYKTPRAARKPRSAPAQRDTVDFGEQWKRQEAEARPQLRPGETLDLERREVKPARASGLTVVGSADERARAEALIDPQGPPNPYALRLLYGVNQLRAALDRYPTHKLRASAKLLGLRQDVSRNKLLDSLVSWGLGSQNGDTRPDMIPEPVYMIDPRKAYAHWGEVETRRRLSNGTIAALRETADWEVRHMGARPPARRDKEALVNFLIERGKAGQ